MVASSVGCIMRQSQSYKSGMPVAQILWVGLMASVATGCSSDSSRFSGLFSKTDSMTTASTGGQITGMANAPVPQTDVDGGGSYAPAASGGSMGGGGYGNRQQAMTQPYPAQQTYSPARRASSAVSVQKAELAPPSGSTASTGPISSRRQTASAQPFPAATHQSAALEDGDGLSTNTLPQPAKPGLPSGQGAGANGQGANGWSTVNAPRVVLKPGESLATLSQRYGVPEKEIVKANGLSTAGAARPGQSILIPTFGSRNTPTRAAAAEGTLLPPGQSPGPTPRQEEKVAVLPTNPKLRDKVKTDIAANNTTNAAGTGKTPPAAGTYVVKSGDSIAKIARENGVSVAALKQANHLGTQGVRVGQTLELPQADQKLAATPVSTAPANTKPEAPKVTAAAPAPAAPTKSVTDVASADPGDKAPDATGIGKYRWPVRGAVVAPFGANVAGKRNDGIDISVPTGTPIKAAENGVVIYAGNGLKELGNTVLVRHDDGTVTVYGHADAISVQRGQKVQRGQQVATSGMSGNASQPTLHFEVRKDATPVNPMGFLE
ncbi:peptidoglycan DD-metalloendopeptidase family protein [Agrobacterium vitis]|nr:MULTISPECIES: LysM peptidoglycan-binding domain-containing M23 family metallopeptidase [Rhizobium/Agrobacterium group]MCF1446400.1 LysM peptidoglycan-binding domain-containing M23 family metallopeptidase [Allorhizobium ampelinum]MCF1492718.1 LysM peptidoglycan-binding domain-containing M23 family metallopeptidase [Allorhizobium ampelinum]MUO31179.1 peptidoglycan DD-metalloendopeptidase family protein [Agrobacterium vitis]MUO44788.1 peptidoglycan DD-metalloendopeptidase family protein [Agroba